MNQNPKQDNNYYDSPSPFQ